MRTTQLLALATALLLTTTATATAAAAASTATTASAASTWDDKTKSPKTCDHCNRKQKDTK